jgi:hypothetical protein
MGDIACADAANAKAAAATAMNLIMASPFTVGYGNAPPG